MASIDENWAIRSRWVPVSGVARIRELGQAENHSLLRSHQGLGLLEGLDIDVRLIGRRLPRTMQEQVQGDGREASGPKKGDDLRSPNAIAERSALELLGTRSGEHQISVAAGQRVSDCDKLNAGGRVVESTADRPVEISPRRRRMSQCQRLSDSTD